MATQVDAGSGYCSAARPGGKQAELTDWMGELDECLHTLPLNRLAIPGSHNSCIYTLDRAGGVSPDGPQAIVNLVKVFGGAAKGIIANWSITQSLTLTQQLNTGIRYLDIRLSARPGTEELFCVHGLYGPSIESCLDELQAFLAEHPKEVVLLDFRAFYAMDAAAHARFLDRLIHRFGALMCPVLDLPSLTLRTLWDSGLQLIVAYHSSDPSGAHFQLWPGHFVPSPWPNVTDHTRLINILSENLNCGGVPEDRFYVSQGVLTPDTGCILAKLGGDLRGCLGAPVAPKFVEWVKGRGVLAEGGKCSTGVNVCMMDFIELGGFAGTVIGLNWALAGRIREKSEANGKH